jgi:uncharacterized protein YoxC
MLGAALSTLPAIIKVVELAAEAAGVTMTAAFGWIAAIVAAVAVIGVVIYKYVKQLKENSPEGKLKTATEEAERAAEVADRLTESYQNLNDSIEDLGDKYNALEDLTRGTKEWNEAVKEINDSVLDLVEQYPQLAELMKNKHGVLTLELDSEAVQNVIIQA